LPGIAARLDAGLNRIYEQLPARANLIILSVHGIEPNFSGNAMVSEFLERLGVLVPAQQEEPSNALGSILLRTRRLREMLPQSVRDFINDRLPDNVHDQAVASAFAGKVDWKRTQVFPLPSDHFQAFLSLNLVGREPDGIVQPGSDAEMLFGRVRAEFMRLVNVDTGRPAVHDVQWIPSLYSGPAAFELPDIVVQWSKDEPIRKLRHPEMGVFEVPHRGLRRSQHTTRGFFLGIGPAFVEQASGPEIDTTDITPTLLHLLGQEPDPDLPGEVRLDLLRAGATPAPGGADMVSGTASTAGQP
jgi:predicted AlkP superfamily phosphohydrolase/phosphomutase